MSLRSSWSLLLVAVLAACGTEPDPDGVPVGGLAIDSTVPSPGSQAAEFGALVSVYFDRALDPATVTGNTIGVLFPDGQTVQGSVAYRAAANAVDIHLPLMPGADYRGVVTIGIHGAGGETVPGTQSWNFRTRPTTRVVIDPAVSLVTVPVMAVDPSGVVHAAYVDSANAAVRYARCASACTTAGGWAATTVASGAAPASRIDLAVSATGSVAVAYYTAASGDLVVAGCTAGCTAAGGWSAATVDGAAADVGLNPSIVFGPSGVLHALYYDRTAKALRYAACPAGCGSAAAWSTPVTIDPGNTRGVVSDIAIGAGGALIAAWTSGADIGTIFGSCQATCTTPSNWTLLPLSATVGFSTRVRIAADSGNRPLVLFGIAEATVAALCLNTSCATEANWAYVGLGQDTGVGAFPALATEPSGQVHVTYASLFRGLRYISCTRACELSPVLWTAGNLDVTGDVNDGAIAIDGSGRPVAIARLENGKPAFVR